MYIYIYLGILIIYTGVFICVHFSGCCVVSCIRVYIYSTNKPFTADTCTGSCSSYQCYSYVTEYIISAIKGYELFLLN